MSAYSLGEWDPGAPRARRPVAPELYAKGAPFPSPRCESCKKYQRLCGSCAERVSRWEWRNLSIGKNAEMHRHHRRCAAAYFEAAESRSWPLGRVRSWWTLSDMERYRIATVTAARRYLARSSEYPGRRRMADREARRWEAARAQVAAWGRWVDGVVQAALQEDKRKWGDS